MQNKQDTIESLILAFNNVNLPSMFEYLDPQIEFKSIQNDRCLIHTNGKKAFKEHLLQQQEYFSKQQLKVKAITEIDNSFVLQIKMQATLAVDLPSGLKKGHVLKVPLQTTIEFNDNLIKSITDRCK